MAYPLKAIGLVGAAAVVLCGVTWLAVPDAVSYFYALHLESGWIEAKPQTREELEPLIWPASAREIQPSESMWGHDYQLRPGEHMTQFLILGYAPLDVVFSQDGQIVHIYTSYE